MAEGHRPDRPEGDSPGGDRPEGTTHVQDAEGVAHLAYRPRPADTVAGLRVRERIKKVAPVVRGVFLVLWVGQWLLGTVRSGNVGVTSTVLFVFVTAVVGGYRWAQAAQVQRIVGWQGEYRVEVSPAGVTCGTEHSTLSQRWSVFRGYRETAKHFVLLSRDPNIMCLDILPKRGARTPEDIERLRDILDRHIPRV